MQLQVVILILKSACLGDGNQMLSKGVFALLAFHTDRITLIVNLKRAIQLQVGLTQALVVEQFAGVFVNVLGLGCYSFLSFYYLKITCLNFSQQCAVATANINMSHTVVGLCLTSPSSPLQCFISSVCICSVQGLILLDQATFFVLLLPVFTGCYQLLRAVGFSKAKRERNVTCLDSVTRFVPENNDTWRLKLAVVHSFHKDEHFVNCCCCDTLQDVADRTG